MTDELRRMPLPAEVHAFHTEVGCDQHVVSARNAEDGAIVPNSGEDGSLEFRG
jgi:hypothetical protein